MGFLDVQANGGAVADKAVEAPAWPAGARAWSDPKTWGGKRPRADDNVLIRAGRCIVVDQDIEVASLTVHGTLLFAERDLYVRTQRLLVAGAGVLRAGSSERPRQHRLTITLTGAESEHCAGGLGNKFLAASGGGTIDLNGARRDSWVLLSESTSSQSVQVRLAQPVDWRAGDRIAIASGGADLPLVEERRIVEVARDRCVLTVDTPPLHRHIGRHAPVLRAQLSAVAKVVLLGRSIVVEGDAQSKDRNYGAHCVVTAGRGEEGSPARTSIGRFRDVEFRRMGQFNRAERYPVQWQDNGDSSASSLVDCLIHESYQRGVVVTGSPHVRISGNVVFKPYGHGYLIEHTDDAAQMIATNLAVRPRVVRFADPLLRGLHEHRPRAFWFAQGRARAPLAGRILGK